MVTATTLQSALDMARRGFRVFPLLPGSRLPVEAKACAAHLRPLAGGVHRATTHAAKIAAWFAVEPALNFGVSSAELCIIDVDVKNGKSGIEDLLGLGVLPPTLTVATGTGGLHLYFQAPAGGAGQSSITKAIDVRGVGGYVVGPGSVVDGNAYEIINDAPLAVVPSQIAPLLSKPGDRADRSAKHLQPCGELDAPGSWDAAMAWLESHAPAVEGEGGDAHTYKTACAMKDLGLSADSALDALLMSWNGRCSPPWDAAELEAKVANAYAYGREQPGSSAPALEFAALPADLAPPAGAASSNSPAPPRFRPLAANFNEVALPPRPWIASRLLLAGACTGLVSDPGAGKSTFSLLLAVCLALGDGGPVGLEIHGGPRTVVLVNNEDDEPELQRRLAAICAEHGIDRDAIQGRVHLHCPADESPFLAVARDPQTRQLRRTRMFAELSEYMGAVGASVFIADPLVEMHEGDENSNADVGAVMKAFRAVARLHKAAGLIIHHTRKAPSTGADGLAGDATVARGASAFHGNVRVLVTLFRMTPAEAEAFGVTGDARLRYARLDFGKGSYQPPGMHTSWFETRSRTLANGDGAPAVRLADLSAHAERAARVLHMQIRGDAMAAGPDGLPLKTAAARLAHDPMMSGSDAAAIARRLRATFETPRTYDGVTVVCEPVDAEAAKPRYVLRGYVKGEFEAA